MIILFLILIIQDILSKKEVENQEKNTKDYEFDNLENLSHDKLSEFLDSQPKIILFLKFWKIGLEKITKDQLKIKKFTKRNKTKIQNYQKHILFNCIRTWLNESKINFEDEQFTQIINLSAT